MYYNVRRRFSRDHPVRIVRLKNPPERKGPEVGLVEVQRLFRGRIYSREVGPRDSVDVQEAAAMLGVSRLGVYMAIREGRLRGKKLRGRVMIPLVEADRYLSKRRRRRGEGRGLGR